MYNTFLYLITVLIWGSTWLAIKFQLGVVAPELSVAYRFGLAASILFIFSLVRRLPLRFNLKSQAYFALQGFLLFSLNYILVYMAESYLTSGLVAIIFSGIIILNIIFGSIFLRNPIHLRVVFGGLVGLLGLSLVFWPELSSFDLSSGIVLGIGLAVVAAVSASLGNVVSARNQRNELPVIQTNAYGMLYGAIFMFVLAIFRGAQVQIEPTVGYLMSLLYLAIFGSVIAFGSYLTLLGRIGLDRAAYVTVLFPIIALLLSTLFEGLTWGNLQLAGVVLVLVGNALVLNKHFKLNLSAPFRREVPHNE